MFSRSYTVEGHGCFDKTRYAHFIPQAHPGPEAPLGWALSQGSFSDLSDQFLKAPVNQQAQTIVQSWFADLSFTPCP